MQNNSNSKSKRWSRKDNNNVFIRGSTSSRGKKVLLIDADSQDDLTTYMGYYDQDSLPVTISTLLERTINDIEVDAEEAVLHHNEGVDLVPSNLNLSMTEVNSFNAMNQEKVGGIFLTLVDKRTALPRVVKQELESNYGNIVEIFDSQIPVAIKTAESTSKGKNGEITTDRYGRNIPKHAHGTINLEKNTSILSKLICLPIMKCLKKVENKKNKISKKRKIYNML